MTKLISISISKTLPRCIKIGRAAAFAIIALALTPLDVLTQQESTAAFALAASSAQVGISLSEQLESVSPPKKRLVWTITRDPSITAGVVCRVFATGEEDIVKFPTDGALLSSLVPFDPSGQFTPPGAPVPTVDPSWNNSTRIHPVASQATYRMHCEWTENGEAASTESSVTVAGGPEYSAARAIELELTANRTYARLGKDLITVTYGGKTTSGERVPCFLTRSVKNAAGGEVTRDMLGFELPENGERVLRTQQYDLEHHILDLTLTCGSVTEKKLRLTRPIILKASKAHIIPGQGDVNGADIDFHISIHQLPKTTCKLLGGNVPITISVPPRVPRGVPAIRPDKNGKYTFTTTVKGIGFAQPITPTQVVCETVAGIGRVESNVAEIYRLMSITAESGNVEARMPLRLSWNAQTLESADRKIAPTHCYLQSPATAWDPSIIGLNKVSPSYSLTVFPPKQKTEYWLSCDYEFTDKRTGNVRTDYVLIKKAVTTFAPSQPKIEYLTEVGSILPEDIQKTPGVNQFFNFYVKGGAGVQLFGDHRVCNRAILLYGGTTPEADFTRRYMIQIVTPDSPQTCKIRARGVDKNGNLTSREMTLPYLVDVRLPATPRVWDVSVSPAHAQGPGRNRTVSFMIEGYSDFQNRDNAEIVMSDDSSPGCATYGKDVESLANQPVYTKRMRLSFQPLSSLSCAFSVRNISNGNQSNQIAFSVSITPPPTTSSENATDIVTDSALVAVNQYVIDHAGAVSSGAGSLTDQQLITTSNPLVANTGAGITTSNPLVANTGAGITTSNPLVANTGAALVANTGTALASNCATCVQVSSNMKKLKEQLKKKIVPIEKKSKNPLKVALSQSQTSIGTPIQVTVAHATPNSPIHFFLHQDEKNVLRIPSDSFHTDASGTFEGSVTIPDSIVLGVYALLAVDVSGTSASKKLTVAEATPQPVLQSDPPPVCPAGSTYSQIFKRCIEDIPVTVEQEKPSCPAGEEYSITLRRCVR
ncbi:hypothetical protein HY620_02340 [Candidatus Uhrbacteria bacterium]|nr:hypothetical protein [Candidatus Uhrbacteria bacterium]